MKTKLPKRSLIVKERLDRTVEEILAVGKDKIAMIILFGSYARGNWVRDSEEKEGIIYTYQSDLDILIILKKGKYSTSKATSLQYAIERRLSKKFKIDITREPIVTLVLEPIKLVNEQLEKGQYFFCDIIKEGVLLYDSGEFVLSEAKKLPWSKRKKVAQEDFDYWFERGNSFLIDCKYPLERNDFGKSAFELHQTTESFYNTILLVFSGYKPKLHDLLELDKMSRVYHHELHKIFPKVTPQEEECFDILRRAYIEGRYNKHFKVTKEQLLYLIERVELLKALTEKICLQKINNG